MKQNASNRAIGYCRVSTDEQAERGYGLDAQRHAIADAAKRLGCDVTAWFSDEGICGAVTIDKRTGLLAALESLRAGDVLLVAKRDRLSRGDAMLTAWIEKEVTKRRARIVSAAGEGTENDDPSSVLMRRIVDAFAEYERLIIGIRTKAALKAKRANGQKTGGHVPYGYRLSDDGSTLLERPDEQAVIQTIIGHRNAGKTYQRIADRLNTDEVPTRTGARWSAKVVRGVCKRAMETMQ